MAHTHHTQEPAFLEDAVTALFCIVDDAYQHINPQGRHYASLKRLSDSEVLTLALVQQLRGVESCRSFLRDAGRFFAELFPGVAGLHPSSFHRRVRKLGRFLEPRWREAARTILEKVLPQTVIEGLLIEIEERSELLRSHGIDVRVKRSV